jgi:hypothetical protein
MMKTFLSLLPLILLSIPAHSAGVTQGKTTIINIGGVSGAYLPLAGGTMSGDIDMSSHSVVKVDTITVLDRLLISSPTHVGSLSFYSTGSFLVRGATTQFDTLVQATTIQFSGLVQGPTVQAFGVVASTIQAGLVASTLIQGTTATFTYYTDTAGNVGTIIPRGTMVMTITSCPIGWSEWVSAQGYYLVTTPSGGTVGGTLGAPMSDLEDKTHKHSINPPDETVQTGSGATVGTNGTYDSATVSNNTFVPYVQVRFCIAP